MNDFARLRRPYEPYSRAASQKCRTWGALEARFPRHALRLHVFPRLCTDRHLPSTKHHGSPEFLPDWAFWMFAAEMPQGIIFASSGHAMPEVPVICGQPANHPLSFFLQKEKFSTVGLNVKIK